MNVSENLKLIEYLMFPHDDNNYGAPIESLFYVLNICSIYAEYSFYTLNICSVFQMFVKYFKYLFYISNIYSQFETFVQYPKNCYIFNICYVLKGSILFPPCSVFQFLFCVLNIRSAFQIYVPTAKYSSQLIFILS